jgi:hypothetical protein
MGFRFRRSIRVVPGLRINLSKSGPSLSVGGRGATVNINERGARTTVGLPGSGLSYSTTRTRWGRVGGSTSLGVLVRAAIALAVLVTLIIAMTR